MTLSSNNPSDPAAFLAAIRPRLEMEIQQSVFDLTDDLDPALEMDAFGVILRDYLKSPGKRLRPLLFLLTLKALDPDRDIDDGSLRFAAGLQVFHEFLLVHDDLIDASESRRGGPTLWKRVASLPDLTLERARSITLVLGDLLYARAVEQITSLDLPSSNVLEALRFLMVVARETGWGAAAEIRLSAEPIAGAMGPSIRAVYRAKTTRYTFEGPMTLAAILTGAGSEIRPLIKTITRPLGLAFQLENDLHELVSLAAPSTPIPADLNGRIKTLPMIRLLEALPDRDGQRLKEIFDRPIGADERRSINQMVGDSKVIEAIRTEIGGLFNEPFTAIRAADIAPEIRDNLSRVIRFIQANRNHSEA
ncbi:MAG: polyprenyl synthetase family protein [Opitutaceae bacterium]